MPVIVRENHSGAPEPRVAELGAAELRIAAHMLNMEAGALAWGAHLERLPAPEPWPIVQLPPRTAAGRPRRVYYRPATGVVYSDDPGLAARLAPLLEAAGSAHLCGARCVGGALWSVMREPWLAETKDAAVGASTAVGAPTAVDASTAVGASTAADAPVSHTVVKHVDPFLRALPPGPARDGRPRRLLLVPPRGDYTRGENVPPAYSARAAFTWVFLPLSAVLVFSARAGTPRSMTLGCIMNALTAGIVYDRCGRLKIADGDAPQLVLASDVDLVAWPPVWAPPPELPLAIALGHDPPLPPTLSRLGPNYAFRFVAARPDAHTVRPDAARPDAARPDAARPDAARPGQLLLVGNYNTLVRRPAQAAAATAAYEQLPVAEWTPDRMVGCGGGARTSRCALCRVPVGGAAVQVENARFAKDARAIASDYRRDARALDRRSEISRLMVAQPQAGDLIKRGDAATETVALICRDCFGATDIATTTMLRAQVSKVAIPWSQSEAAHACGFKLVAKLLAGTAVSHTAGAVTVALAKKNAGATICVTLVGAALGPWPTLDHPNLSASPSLVLPGVNLIDG